MRFFTNQEYAKYLIYNMKRSGLAYNDNIISDIYNDYLLRDCSKKFDSNIGKNLSFYYYNKDRKKLVRRKKNI